MSLLVLNQRIGALTISRITKRTINAADPRDRVYYLWDSDLKGYALKVAPTGRKTFVIKYQLGGRQGPQRWMSLGRYGQITAEHARKDAKRLLGEVASGSDPAKARKKTKVTLENAMREFFVSHVSRLKPSTATYYEDLNKKYVLPAFGKRDITEIERSEIARHHQKLHNKRYQANRVLALLSKFFNWCELHGYRRDGTNPCRHIAKYTEKQRTRFMSDAEMAKLGEALRREPNPFAVAAIKLLLLTGMRKNEILRLKWSEVSIDTAEIRLSDSKTGAKTVPLSPPALDILKNLPQISDNPFVIVGKKPGSHLVNIKSLWQRVLTRANIQDLRIHDMRHSFASVGAASNMSLPILGALLHHSQPSTTQKYAHFSNDPIRKAGDKIAGQIADALEGKAGGEVVRLRR